MISLLIPVEDMDETISCISNAFDKARDINNVEFILVFTTGDVDNLSRIPEIPECNVRIIDCGDLPLNEKVNRAAEKASGTLMYWNEKNRFLTRGFDEMLNIDGIFVGQTATVSTFLPMSTYQVLGHYSLHNQINDYLLCLGKNTGLARKVNVINTAVTAIDPHFDCKATMVLLQRDIGTLRRKIEETPN